MGADRRAVSQPTPSVCLCANAVLKWAHYHQREHKHSSRKQDSLCQEREPLPQAHCRPDEITRLKIRQGSYYYCRHALQAAPALHCWRRQSSQLLKHSLSSFFSDCSVCFSPPALSVCCKLQGFKVYFCQSWSTYSIFSLIIYDHGFSGRFPVAIEPCREHHYSFIYKSLISCIQKSQCIIHKSHFGVHSVYVSWFLKASCCSACNICVWVCYVFSLSSSP